MVKNLPANAGNAEDVGLMPGSGRSPGGENDNPLQYSCLENSMTEEPGGLQSMGSQSQTRLKQLSTFTGVPESLFQFLYPYSFPLTDITNHHRLSGLKQQRFILPQFWSPEVETQDVGKAKLPSETLGLNSSSL